jgi:hypothetical protein
MPKSSKRSSEKDALSFIKKVAAAGRGGDTELAYLSTNARALLKKLGGAGTVNPKTKLPEYRAANAAARRRQLEMDEDLGEFSNSPVGRASMSEPGVGSSAADLEQILAAGAPQPSASMLFDASSPGAESSVASPEPGVAVQREVTPGFDAERQYTPNPQAFQSPQQEPTPTFSGMAPMVPEDFASQYKPGSLTTESGKVNAAFFDPAMDRASIPNVDPETLPKAAAPAAAPGSAADDLSKLPVTTRQRTPEQMAERRAVREQEDLWRSPAEREPLAGGRRGDAALEAERRAAEESARRAAEEEAARRAAEESARRAAEEEASRRAQEEAARRAAEEAAARRAQEEAARMAAEEEARRRAAQDAAAARAAEEARRLAEAEAARRAQEEAARRAAEEEARRRAEQAKPQPEPRPQPQPQPPPGLTPSPQPTLPKPPTATPPSSGGGITTPPEKEKPFRTTDFIDQNLNGIDDRDEKPPTKSEPGPVRTADFIDKNLNGIDDRDEKPSSSRSPGFDFSGLVDPNSDVGRLIGRIGRGSSGRGSLPFKRGAGTKVTNPPVLNPVKPGRPPSEQPPPSTPGNPPPTEPPVTSPPVYGGYTPGPIPVTTLPKPGYIANPLPKAPGAGTSTPYFTPNTGGLTPGTLPVSGTLPSLGTSQLPLQAIGQNPNLSPTMLGGEQNAGYYTDRFGNKILSPVARGFSEGGPTDVTDLMEDREPRTTDQDSARSLLERMPKRSQGRKRKKERKEPKSLLEGTFSRPGLSRAGDLAVSRFAEGGGVKKKQGKLKLPPDRSKGFREEGIEFNPDAIPAAQVRTYLNTLFGETRPITERDFTKAELRLALEAMKKAKESGRGSTVDYRDYGIPLTPFADLDPSEQASIRNTLGVWNYETKDGTLRGKDRYDFDRDLGGRSSAEYAKMSLPKKLGVLALDTVNVLPMLKDMYNMSRLKPMTGEGVAYGPFTLPHRIGAAFMPPGGREVNIDFGKEAAKELEQVVPRKKGK